MSIPSGPMPASALAQLLHTEPPDRQRMLLGESLYPLVARSQPQLAGKITGMLLEIDQSEILHLIETPDALNSKIEEALQVSSSSRRLTLSLPPFFPFFFSFPGKIPISILISPPPALYLECTGP